MYLKRLEMHGFKSFAPKSGFEFGTGVTCIAGPNGSGKTNVADAIRWVLGEQASRIIRARKTEDIIFSGSTQRPAMGMAEVKIVLDNEDGWLPIDFGEVVVARRAYRSGENEYYLNQSRVRLKDLTELFLKAQVGQNSYAFMGQGLVEQVLTLRPEERRGLIEEAADVRLHRDKLDLARNRLAATRDNLERVDMLVREIAPRLRQLERQVDRAEAHQKLSAELAEALHTLYGQQWQDAHGAIAGARAYADQRKEEFHRAKRDYDALEGGVGSLATALQQQRTEIAEREAARRNVEEYRRDLEHRITFDGERIELLRQRSEELTTEQQSLREEREQLVALLGQHDERTEAVGQELALAREPDAEMRRLAELDERLRHLRTALAEAGRLASAAAAQRAQAEGRGVALRRQHERFRSELVSLEESRHDQLGLLKGWAREFASRRQRVHQLGPTVQRVAREFGDAQDRLDRISTAHAARQEHVRTLAVKIETSEAKLEAAESTHIDLPPADAGVQAVLAAGNLIPDQTPDADNRIMGVVGMLGQLLRVPEGLERAIEAALAEAVHGIVVERQEDAIAAAELLLGEDLGRATIFPLSDMKVVHPINITEERGVLGVASDLVRCDSRYRTLVNTLLGRFIVAQNLGIAKGILRRGMGSVVTLDGIVLHPTGSMTAGSARAVRRALAHQRETGELPQELQRMKAEHIEVAAALDLERGELAAAQRTHDELSPEVERMRAELADAEEALRQHRTRLTSTAARLNAVNARRAETLRGISEAEDGLAVADQDTQRAGLEFDEHEGERARLTAEQEDLTAQREHLVQGTAARSTHIAALEAEHESISRQRSIQSASLTRVQDDLRRREEMSAKIAEELEQITSRLAAARRELEEKTQEAATAGEELVPARAALEQVESRQRSISDEINASRAASLQAERALMEAEAAVHLRSEELESLKTRLEEEGFRPSPEGEIVAVPEPDQPPAWLTTEQGDSPAPMRGGADVDPVALKDRVAELRADIRSLGPVNIAAESDYAENKERHDFLSTQLGDLREAEQALQGAIEELESIIKERFSSTFNAVNKQFSRYFETFFGGGQAELLLTAPDEYGLPGVDIVAQPPRKRVRTINMLSGGERSLTAVALLFALLETNPSPICVLDEVDAALDEANVGRFAQELRALSERTQFIIITHNRRTLEMADTIYGVSMGADSTSTVLSLRLADIPDKK